MTPETTPAVETPAQEIPQTQIPSTGPAADLPATEAPSPAPEEPAAPEGPSREEQEQALNVYRMLNDPKTGPHVAKMLAERFGILQPEKREEPKRPTAADYLAQSLGSEYAFLAPKLASGLEGYIQSVVAPLQEQFQRSQVAQEFSQATESLNSSTRGDYAKHESKIVELMDIMRPAPGVPIKSYLSHLYTIAKGSPPPTGAVQRTVERMTRNAQEALPPPSAATENKVIKGPALPSLQVAIEAALRGERFQ